LLNAAKRFALDSGHCVVGTEHFVYAMCNESNESSRAFHWIARVTFPEGDDSVHLFKKSVTEWISQRPRFLEATAPQQPVNYQTELPYSDALQTSLDIAKRIGSAPVQDGNKELKDGIVASEFILAAMLVEGTGLGVEALTRFSSGKVNSYLLLKEIKAKPEAILLPDSSEGSWSEFHSTKFKSEEETSAWFPECSLSKLKSQIPDSPTPGSNWLIPGRLIIGEHPTTDAAKKLLSAGVNIFVSLIGEYDLAGYKTRYPEDCEDTKRRISFIHYPIRDFSTTNASHLARLVNHLRRKLLQGNTIYIHCRGGHGRTGMVIIPLLCSIYEVPAAEAQNFVTWSTITYRENDRFYASYIRMPETKQQVETAFETVSLVTKRS